MSNYQSRYIDFAKQALIIMNIGFDVGETMETLTSRIKTAMPLPGSATELAIRELTRKIGSEIENAGNILYIEQLIDELEYEVSFIAFD
ncbi:MAG: hypothetical protein ACYDBJ_20595 [Aggregatilineales bacterium]